MTVNDAPRPADADPHRTQPTADWRPLVACSSATFVLLLYTSILTVALPRIGADLGASFTGLQWVVDVYTVALAALLLTAGALGDAVGVRRVYLVGAAGFAVATLCAGLAPSAGWLVTARGAQGIAGAAMFATVPALIGRAYPNARQRATAFAAWGVVAGAASAVGTVAGGVLVQWLDWRWLFLAGVPLAVLAWAAGLRSLPHDPQAQSRPGANPAWASIALVTLAVGASAYAVVSAGESGIASPHAIAAAAVAVAAAVALVWRERTAANPMLPRAMLASGPYRAVLLTSFAYYFAAFGVLPSAASWLQSRAGVAPAPAGVLLVVQLASFSAASAVVGPSLPALSARRALALPLALVALGAAGGALVVPCPQWWALLPFLVLTGIGAGVISPALPSLSLAAAPAGSEGVASAASNASRQLGLALGVAVTGAMARAGGDGGLAAAFAASAGVALAAATVAWWLCGRADRVPAVRTP